MIIRLPDLEQAEGATPEEQLEKVVEEMHESRGYTMLIRREYRRD